MDNSAALLLKCCDYIEKRMIGFGHDAYKLMQSNDDVLIQQLKYFDCVLTRTREYIYLGLFTQARRLISVLQLLCNKVLQG